MPCSSKWNQQSFQFSGIESNKTFAVVNIFIQINDINYTLTTMTNVEINTILIICERKRDSETTYPYIIMIDKKFVSY